MKNRKFALFYHRKKGEMMIKRNSVSEKILERGAEFLKEWESGNATLDDCLEQLRAENGHEKSAVASLLFEYFRHKGFVDSLIRNHARRGNVKQEMRVVVACALTQALFQTGIAPQSAVNIAVDSVKRRFGHGPGAFVNAILRAVLASPEAGKLPASSFPEALREKWLAQFGKETTARLLDCYASNPRLAFRIRAELPEDELKELQCTPVIAEGLPQKFRFYQTADPDGFFRKNWLEQGMVYVQDPATALALSLLDGSVSGRVLDACAAPGGKTIMLSDLADGGDLRLTAADRSPQRLRQLNINLKRAGVRARTLQASAQENPFEPASFDLILADVPCSNSGVIRRRPDAPWRYQAKRVTELSLLQADILDSLSRLVRPGGRLLYSTCSIEPEENTRQIENFLALHPDFLLKKQALFLPSEEHDGAFGALLEKIAPASNG